MSHSELNTVTVEEQTKPKHKTSTDVDKLAEPYKNKSKISKRSSSSRKSSRNDRGASESSPGMSSRSSIRKQNSTVDKNK